MSKRIVLSLVLAVIVLIGVGVACYQWGRSSVQVRPLPPPSSISEPVYIRVPGESRVEYRTVNSDTSDVAQRRASLAAWERELRRAADSLGKYGTLYVEADTTLTRRLDVYADNSGQLEPVESLYILDRIKLRYGVPPIDYLDVLAGPIRAIIQKAITESPTNTLLDDVWDTYRSTSAYIVTLAILLGILWIVF